jgi:hypothetical protein
MRWTRVRVSMGQLMVLIAAFGFGLAISPPGAPYLGLLPPVALGLASLRLWAIAVPAVSLLAICAVGEILLEIVVPGWIYVSIAILISGPLWPEGPGRWRSRRLIPLVAVNALILVLFLVPWSGRKTYFRDLASIKPGMTVAEVGRIMAPYRENYEHLGPDRSGGYSLLFRCPTSHWVIDTDWDMVKIRDGKVVDVGFLPK